MALKHQAFFYSLFFSRLADQIILFLVPLVIFQLTRSVAWSGAAFLLETLPRFLSFPIFGAMCDRKSPLTLLHVSQRLRAAACFAGMAGYASFGGVGWLIGISAACGVMTTQGLMAREVLVPQVFHQHRFEKVVSYTQIADQLGTVLGPFVAVALLKLSSWEFVVISTTVLFLVADGAVAIWQRFANPVLSEPAPAANGWVRQTKTALQHIVRRPGLMEVIILGGAVKLVVGATLATSAAMVTGVHGQTDTYYALLQVAGAIATVAILSATAHVPASLQLLGIIGYVMIFVGGVATGLASHFPLYSFGFILIVGFDQLFSVFTRTLRVRLIPRQDLGKTMGFVVMLPNLSQPLAGLMVSLFASAHGTGTVILALSLLMGLLGPLGAIMWLRRGARLAALNPP